MRCFLHSFGKWEDVDLRDEGKSLGFVPGFVVVRRVVKQQRRCSRCNLVQTRGA